MVPWKQAQQLWKEPAASPLTHYSPTILNPERSWRKLHRACVERSAQVGSRRDPNVQYSTQLCQPSQLILPETSCSGDVHYVIACSGSLWAFLSSTYPYFK